MPDSNAQDLVLVDLPDGPARSWVAVWRDPFGTHWLQDKDDDLVRVHPDAAENWVSADPGPVWVFAHDGRVINPADEPPNVLDLLRAGNDLEQEVLRIAAEKLDAGESLTLEERARVALAKRRLEAAA